MLVRGVVRRGSKSSADAPSPKTMSQEWDELAADERVAIVHLGFHDAEDYKERIERSRTKKAGWSDAVKALCRPVAAD